MGSDKCELVSGLRTANLTLASLLWTIALWVAEQGYVHLSCGLFTNLHIRHIQDKILSVTRHLICKKSRYENKNESIMMTSSNENIFRVTGHLCGEFIGHWWIPRAKANDAKLWCFLDLRLNKRLSKQCEAGDRRHRYAQYDIYADNLSPFSRYRLITLKCKLNGRYFTDISKCIFVK